MYTKKDFMDIANIYIRRDGIKELLSNLEKSDFFIAPASSRFHDNVKGGLCHHCVKVYNYLVNDAMDDYSMETIAIVALFHDLCKIGYYEESTKNVKDETTGKWHTEPFYKINDTFPMGHGEKSLFIINDCMKLSTEEALAIRWHMSGYEPKENYQYVSATYNTVPLAVLLSVADMKATYLPEKEGN